MKHLKQFEDLASDLDPDNIDWQEINPKKSYEILYKNGVPNAIKCLDCNITSYSPGDIEHLYCGNCRKFHVDQVIEKKDYKKLLANLRKRRGETAKEAEKKYYSDKD